MLLIQHHHILRKFSRQDHYSASYRVAEGKLRGMKRLARHAHLCEVILRHGILTETQEYIFIEPIHLIAYNRIPQLRQRRPYLVESAGMRDGPDQADAGEAPFEFKHSVSPLRLTARFRLGADRGREQLLLTYGR